tara:strand:- start:122 stop:1201 length:1080 start_codon:yes stop_codon:yes gene_type:complete
MCKWLLIFLPIVANAQVGSISELRGIGEVLRQDSEDSLEAELELSIDSMDNVRTGNGRLSITFLDDSTVSLTERSSIVIDDFVFDPDPSQSRLALNMASGTARFLTGALGRINRENLFISTPTASVAIRGTEFTTHVSEIGETMVILLPDENGDASGEIVVTSMAGEVVMNEPWQATAVTVSESPPTPPVILQGMTMNFLNNLLIVSPPDEIQEAVDEQSGTASNILDVDLLEEDALEDNELDEDALEEDMGRLDIDLLAADFLGDLLVQVSESRKQAKVYEMDGVEIEGVIPGFDQQLQVYTFTDGPSLFFVREVENTIDLELDKASPYKIDIMTAGVKIQAEVNGGGDNAIYIRQSN